jgi:hypothetical protein
VLSEATAGPQFSGEEFQKGFKDGFGPMEK